MAQLMHLEWQTILVGLTAVERLLALLTKAHSQLKAAETSFSEKLEEQT